eukprot:Phypoly_transcript_22909.p1 GENE.Phypoly_transcript_22909~~Phypoly_transcript_22909.p1  ORF type:complete len:173 (+),score=33.47 Phypoly_transcript_22909:41-559(+)
MLPPTSILALFLALIEGFHALAHINVLMRMYPPRYASLNNRGWYFLWDGTSHIIPYFLHGRFFPYLFVEFVAHMFYTITWNRNWYFTERIKKWSTKEYYESGGKWVTYDFFLTISDIIGHSLNVYALCSMLGMYWWGAVSCSPFILYSLFVEVKKKNYKKSLKNANAGVKAH